MKLRKICKNKLAFTLVELVVVIAILAILAGAVAGAVVGIRASANKSEVSDLGAKFADALQLACNAEDKDMKLTNSMSQDDVIALMKKYIPENDTLKYVKKDTSPDSGMRYIQVPAKPSAGWLTAESIVFKVYTSNYSMSITLNGKTTSVSKGSLE